MVISCSLDPTAATNFDPAQRCVVGTTVPPNLTSRLSRNQLPEITVAKQPSADKSILQAAVAVGATF